MDSRIRNSTIESSEVRNQCIWMAANVVNFKICDNAYNCTDCAFDKAMAGGVKKKPTVLVSWRDVLRLKPFNQRECRHMISGRVQYKFCANNYECNVCEFDQDLDEEDLSGVEECIPASMVSGFAIADNCYYYRGHSWARREIGGFVRLGIDDFALRLLGSPTKLHLPEIGRCLVQGGDGWTLRRDNKIAKMLSPLDGVVVATNQKVLKDPGLVRKDPYGQGWLIVIEPRAVKKGIRKLHFEKKATRWLGAEAKRLAELVQANYGIPLAATGGEIIDDIIGSLPNLKWEELVHEFLLT